MLFCSQLESHWLRCELPRPRLRHTLPDETVDLRRLTQQHLPPPHPPLPAKHAHQADVDPSLPDITIILKSPLLLLLLLLQYTFAMRISQLDQTIVMSQPDLASDHTLKTWQNFLANPKTPLYLQQQSIKTNRSTARQFIDSPYSQHELLLL